MMIFKIYYETILQTCFIGRNTQFIDRETHFNGRETYFISEKPTLTIEKPILSVEKPTLSVENLPYQRIVWFINQNSGFFVENPGFSNLVPFSCHTRESQEFYFHRTVYAFSRCPNDCFSNLGSLISII